MIEILKDATIDTIKLIPFLFITYLIMEYIENKTTQRIKEKIKKSGKFGPLIGSIAGSLPQCGFSASATNLYSSRLISIGTLIAVYLSTSDEMVPIFISEAMPASLVFKVLGIKLVLGIFWGYIIDFIINRFILRKGNTAKKNKEFLENEKGHNLVKEDLKEEENIGQMCEDEHCHCHEQGILKASAIHTINITFYIFIITLVINAVIGFIGEETIEEFIKNNIFLGPVISSLIGLIPNCAASVIITNLYIENVINMASLIAGLLTGAGVGLLVLFRTNKKHFKENIGILALMYFIGVFSGLFLQIFMIMS